MNGLSVIVLAAGLGTRMKSSLVKVLHPIAGRPMLSWTIENVMGLKPARVITVLGHQAKAVSGILPTGVEVAIQKRQLGTADAVKAGLVRLKGVSGTVMVVSGDTPLLGTDTFRALLGRHRRTKADVSVLTAGLAEPFGYGRIVRNPDGSRVVRIVEEKDASTEEKKINEINAGTYCFEIAAFKKALKHVKTDNAQSEFYLTDVVSITDRLGGRVIGVPAVRPDEALGINSRVDLAKAERAIRLRINHRHMESGVSMTDPETTYIEPGVIVGPDTVIFPGNHLRGNTVIGRGCKLMPGNVITDCTIKDGVVVKGYSVMTESCVDESAQVGPFAHLRPGTRLEQGCRVGNFVETKSALIGAGTKASHLSYIGDAILGRDVNIGAGTITCNYDGKHKHKTVIGDGVFVGSDTQFIAPVTIGRGAVIAAGTTVTADVPEGALAISRKEQCIKEGWAAVRACRPGKPGKPDKTGKKT